MVVWEWKVLILQQIILIQGEASMSSCKWTGFEEDLLYSATPPRRRVWTRSTLKAVKLLRDISASSTDVVSHVSVKALIDGSLEDISKLSFVSLGSMKQELVSSIVTACRPPKNYECPISKLEFATETFCGHVEYGWSDSNYRRKLLCPICTDSLNRSYGRLSIHVGHQLQAWPPWYKFQVNKE